MNKIKITDLAEKINAKIIAENKDVVITHVAGLQDAKVGALSFLANQKYLGLLEKTKASAVIVGKDIDKANCALLQVDNPDLAFTKAVSIINPPSKHPENGIHPSVIIGKNVVIGKNVHIGPGTVIEDNVEIGENTIIYPQVYLGNSVKIAENCLIYPQVVIYQKVEIGNNCIIHAGAVVGADGFGYVWHNNAYVKIPQVGTVVIKDNVEIGANTCIDRARFGETVIGRGTKLDNLIQIAHNVQVGDLCAFAAQVGIAGSAEVGNAVQMGGQAAIVGHLKVGDQVTIVGQSAVTKNIQKEEGKKNIWIGTPAKPIEEQLKEWQNTKALKKIRNTLKDIEKKLEKIENSEKQEAKNE